MSPVVSKHARAPVKLGCSLALGRVNANVRASMSLASVVTKRKFSAALDRVGMDNVQNNPILSTFAGQMQKPGFPVGTDTTFGVADSQPVLGDKSCLPDNLIGKATVMGYGPPKAPCYLRDRPYVPCSGDVNLPEEVPSATPGFPHRLVCKDSFSKSMSVDDFADFAREYYDDNLTKFGCVVLSNTPIHTVKDYNRFITLLGYRTMSYLHYMKFMNARSMQSTQVEAAVRTASDEPGDYCIEPHCEYHTAGLPKKISLWCDKPSETQGESLLSNNRKIFEELAPEVRKKFGELGCEYEVYYPSKKYAEYNHWEGNISCDKAKVEEYLESQGYTWVWEEDRDALRYKKTIPAIHEHDETGEECWFNQIAAHHWTFYEGHPKFRDIQDKANFRNWPVTTRYGDGSPIEEETLAHIRQVVWKNTVAVDLEHGDIVLCDNYLVKHGRMPYPKEDKSRKVYVSVAYD